MQNSIKANLKNVTRQSVSIPVEAAAVALEVTSDAADLVMGTVRGALPTTKRLGNIVGMFVTGMLNSEISEESAKEIYAKTSLDSIFGAIEESALKAGQDIMSGWDEDEVDTSAK